MLIIHQGQRSRRHASTCTRDLAFIHIDRQTVRQQHTAGSALVTAPPPPPPTRTVDSKYSRNKPLNFERDEARACQSTPPPLLPSQEYQMLRPYNSLSPYLLPPRQTRARRGCVQTQTKQTTLNLRVSTATLQN